MRSLSTFKAVMLHRAPVDGRKQINGLTSIAREAMHSDPLAGGLFAFVNKSKDTVRLLYWDRSGFAMWTKRLEKEKFRWPTKFSKDVISLSSNQLNWLLEGLDIARLQPHETLHFPDLT